MAVELPRAGSGILLRDLAEVVYLSRIESWDRHRITVVKPMGVPAAFPYPDGAAFDVLWTSERGLHVLPTELAAHRSEGAVRLWELAPVAEPWIEQRRAYVRVPAFGRVSLTAPDPSGVRLTVTGYMVDMSEAAMQCILWAEPDNPMLVSGVAVTVEFQRAQQTFLRRGLIHGARSSGEEHRMTAVVTFEQTKAEATELRREVFAAQVDLRRLYPRSEVAE